MTPPVRPYISGDLVGLSEAEAEAICEVADIAIGPEADNRQFVAAVRSMAAVWRDQQPIGTPS